MNLPSSPRFDQKSGQPSYERGGKWPAWFAIAIPFLAIMPFLFRHVRSLCWGAALTLILFFEITTIFVEHHAVIMGHWVYNTAKLIGPTVWNVPIEEPLIYYLFPPVFTVLVLHLFCGLFERTFSKKKNDSSTSP
jgi:hypothetical protein